MADDTKDSAELGKVQEDRAYPPGGGTDGIEARVSMKEGPTDEQAAKKEVLTDQRTAESNSKNTESNPQNTDMDDGLAIRKVVIGEEGDLEEQEEGAEDAVVGLSYQDHNYGRRSGNVHRNEGDDGEKFPIIGGLASYIGEGETERGSAAQCSPSADVRPAHRSRGSEAPRRYSGRSLVTDPRPFSGTYSRFIGGYQMDQARRASFPVGGPAHFRQTAFAATQNYRVPSRGMAQISRNTQGDTTLLRSRQYAGPDRTFGTAAPSSKQFLRPPPQCPAPTTSRQNIRTVNPIGKPLLTAVPAYAAMVGVANVPPNCVHTAPVNTGTAPFIVPSRRPRPVARGRGRMSREMEKEAELLLQRSAGGSNVQTPASNIQVNSTGHTEGSVNVGAVAMPRQRQKNAVRSKGASKQQYMMAEPLEPCHVPQLQRFVEQRMASSVEAVEGMTANESGVENAMLKNAEHTVVESNSKEKKLNNSLQDECLSQDLSGISQDPPFIIIKGEISYQKPPVQRNIVLPQRQRREMESALAGSRERLAQQLGELRLHKASLPRVRSSECVAVDARKAKEVELHVQQCAVHYVQNSPVYRPSKGVNSVQGIDPCSQEPLSAGHTGDTYSHTAAFLGGQSHETFVEQHNENQELLLSAAVNSEALLFPKHHYKGKITNDSVMMAAQSTELKNNELVREVSSVDDASSGEEPHTYSGSHQETTKPLLDATRSSVSGAEEETSVTGNDEKGTEDEGDAQCIQATGSDVSLVIKSGDECGEQYTTRCYCGLTHNDEFMIQCDGCNVWQHGKCMDVDSHEVPDVYKCEECSPRFLNMTKAEARLQQLRALAQESEEVEQSRRKKARVQESKKNVHKKKKKDNPAMDYVECFKYVYTRPIMAFSRKHEDTGESSVLESLRKNNGVSVMYVTPVSKGLVSTRTYHRNELVIYICGRVSLPRECHGREPGKILPFVTLYSDLVVDESSERTPICIDAREFGSIARFARASCRPNIKLHHFFVQGKLHIVGIAAENIDRGEEVTVPFDDDFLLSKTKLVCACSAEDYEDDGNKNCLIRSFNRSLEQKESANKTEVVDLARHSVARGVGKSKARNIAKRLMRSDNNKNPTDGKTKSKMSGVTVPQKSAGTVYGGGVTNTIETVVTAAAVTPATEDENTSFRDSSAVGCSEIEPEARSIRRKCRKKVSIASRKVPVRSVAIKHHRRPTKLTNECVNVDECVDSVDPKTAEMRASDCKEMEAGSDQGKKTFSPAAEMIIVGEGKEKHEEHYVTAVGEEGTGRSVKEEKFAAKSKSFHLKMEEKKEIGQDFSGVDSESDDKKSETIEQPRQDDSSVDVAEKTVGDSANKSRRKKSSISEEADVVNYMLPGERKRTMSREERKVLQELALFERIQQREARRQQYMASSQNSGSIRSHTASTSASAPLESKKNIKNMVTEKERSGTINLQRKQSASKKAKKRQAQRRVSNSKDSLTLELKRKRTVRNGSTQNEQSSAATQESGNDAGGKTTPSNSETTNTQKKAESAVKQETNQDMTEGTNMQPDVPSSTARALSRKASLLQRARLEMEIDPVGAAGADTGLKEDVPSDHICEKDLKNEEEPLKKKVKECNETNSRFNGMGKQNGANISSGVLADEFSEKTDVAALIHEIAGMDRACEPSDFFVDFQTLEGVEFPSTSFDISSGKVQISNSETPKKKMSLDEYKKRKCSKLCVSTANEKNEGENIEEKAAQRSRSFIPSMNINESGGKRTSLRLGTLPDPVHLRPASMLSIDDLKRRIYRRRAPSSTPTSSTDGVSSPLMIQKTGAGMHTPTGQASDVGHSNSAPPPLRGTPVPLPPPPPPPPAPSVVSVNREARLPLEERLRLVLGCGEASSNLNSGRAFAPAGPPSLPPPPPPPLGNSDMSLRKRDLSDDASSVFPLPPSTPLMTPSYSHSNQYPYEAHALGPRKG